MVICFHDITPKWWPIVSNISVAVWYSVAFVFKWSAPFSSTTTKPCFQRGTGYQAEKVWKIWSIPSPMCRKPRSWMSSMCVSSEKCAGINHDIWIFQPIGPLTFQHWNRIVFLFNVTRLTQGTPVARWNLQFESAGSRFARTPGEYETVHTHTDAHRYIYIS